jgi:peptidyl-prolyl cis-trans isomerase B (cyclophilin B)
VAEEGQGQGKVAVRAWLVARGPVRPSTAPYLAYAGPSTQMAQQEAAVRRFATFVITIALLVAHAACTAWKSPTLNESERGQSTGIPAPTEGPSLGTPPVKASRQGSLTLTFTTNLGVVTVQVDRSAAPCTAASLEFLARERFYDGTRCHRLVVEIAVLQCGDPTGQGQGGPGYRFKDENLPDRDPAYETGDVAMSNTGESNTNGSQFFFVYAPTDLPGYYSLFGHVTGGLDLINEVAAAGDDGAFASGAGGGHLKRPFTFNTVQAHTAGG